MVTRYVTIPCYVSHGKASQLPLYWPPSCFLHFNVQCTENFTDICVYMGKYAACLCLIATSVFESISLYNAFYLTKVSLKSHRAD